MVMKGNCYWLVLAAFIIGCQDSATITAPEESKLQKFDSLMTTFMSENEIDAGALSIMKNGRVVYDKSFGWKDSAHTQILPQGAMMRLASVSKPITAAAIMKLIESGELDLSTRAFDFGEDVPGVLELDTSPVLGDTLFKQITVEHLLQHRSGWDREVDKDWVFHEVEIATALGITSPPGQEEMVSFLLGRSLQFTPNSKKVYSNVGYLVLGLIIEKISGQKYMDYVHK